MPTRSRRRCPRCKRLHPGKGQCQVCRGEVEAARGSATARGYGAEHRRRFRSEVLSKHPICVLCKSQPSTVADHWPRSRRELEAAGDDPNDPRYGRGLCETCHNRETARNQPGGWNRKE